MKIAIASSGLGHIRRGVETWAAEIATSLHRAGKDVTLFQGGGEATEPWQMVLPCTHRFDPTAQRLAGLLKRMGGWHYGMGSPFEVEQTTFAMALWSHVWRNFDVIHVKEPWIARWLDLLNRHNLSRPRVVISHGTEEPFEVLRQFSAVQHMAPCYLEEYQPSSPAWQLNFVVPNFIDMTKFPPGDRRAARQAWGFPEDPLIFLCVAAIKRTHKRIDYLIEEFRRFAQTGPAAKLVIAGAREPETDEIIRLGQELLGDKVIFLENVPRRKMLSLYQAADVFILTSLHEMFGNVFLEAMSTGLPVICNNTPTLRWVVGPAGLVEDLSKPGNLAAQLQAITEDSLRSRLAKEGIRQVREKFSDSVVIPQMLEMYQTILDANRISFAPSGVKV